MKKFLLIILLTSKFIFAQKMKNDSLIPQQNINSCWAASFLMAANIYGKTFDEKTIIEKVFENKSNLLLPEEDDKQIKVMEYLSGKKITKYRKQPIPLKLINSLNANPIFYRYNLNGSGGDSHLSLITNYSTFQMLGSLSLFLKILDPWPINSGNIKYINYEKINPIFRMTEEPTSMVKKVFYYFENKKLAIGDYYQKNDVHTYSFQKKYYDDGLLVRDFIEEIKSKKVDIKNILYSDLNLNYESIDILESKTLELWEEKWENNPLTLFPKSYDEKLYLLGDKKTNEVKTAIIVSKRIIPKGTWIISQIENGKIYNNLNK